MAKPHKEAQARKFLKLIRATLGQQNEAGMDIRCCFAAGAFNIGKKNETSVIIVRPVGLESLEGTLKKMPYDNKDSGVKFKSSDPVKVDVVGWIRYNGANILIDLKEGNESKAKRRVAEYFDDFGIGAPKVKVDNPLTEEQKNIFASVQEENHKYIDMADDDVEGDEAVPSQQAGVAEPATAKPPAGSDSDTEGSAQIYTPATSEGEDEDLMAGASNDSDSESSGSGTESIFDQQDERPEEPPSDEPELDPKLSEALDSLSEPLKQDIAAQSQKIAEHALSLSLQIGAEQKAELDGLMGKIGDWLAKMLAATPEGEREMKLFNFTSRLLMMLSYSVNLRNVQHVDDSQKADHWKRYASAANGDDGLETIDLETVTVNGVDLATVPTGDLDQGEVTQILFDLAKTRARERLLPYPLNQASPDRIAKIVASEWPEGEGQAVARSQLVERLIDVLKPMLGTDKGLINLLGFKPTDKAEGANLVASLVDSIEDVWQRCRANAMRQKDEVKARVNQVVNVENLGGTWRHVDDIFLQIDDEISNQLKAIIGLEGEARAKAIDLVQDTVRTNRDYLEGNNIVKLLDEPPFEGMQGTIGETLRQGLDGVSSGLQRIESLGTAAAA